MEPGKTMKLSSIKPENREAILTHPEANNFISKFDAISYDIKNGKTFDVLGYRYDDDGILEYVESQTFEYDERKKR